MGAGEPAPERDDGHPARPGPDGARAGPPPEPHPAIQPVAFLLGGWQGPGVAGYPTMTAVRFWQEVRFSHIGKPYLSYTSQSWLLGDADGDGDGDGDGAGDGDGEALGRPLAAESGYWRPQPAGAIEVLLCHPTGIAEIYLGQVTGTRIEMATDAVARTGTAKPVTAGRRLYGLIGADLGYAFDMAAVGQPLQPHASARLKRVQPATRPSPAAGQDPAASQ
jgi:hypothetical protein